MVTAAPRESEKRSGNLVPEMPARVPAAAAGPNPIWASLAVGGRPSLAVSQPGDPSETEAERIADQIMSGPASPATQSPSAPVQRSCAACDASGTTCAGCEEEEVVQRRAVDGAPVTPNAPEAGVGSALGAGSSLDAPTERWFEARMGADLSGVRVHTGAGAGRAAGDLNAHAFTIGPHIAFADGQYAPRTTTGRRLLAHELVHVLQGGHAIRRSAVSGTPGDVSAGEGEAPQRGVYVPAGAPSGPPPIPSPESCPPPKDMACTPASSSAGAVTNTIVFPQDSDGLTTLQRAEIDAAAAWHTAGGSVMVRVDGFASAEGPCDYNWNLSCRRAQAVQRELATPSDGSAGVSGGNIEVVAHGESDEAGRALAPNRKATISIPGPPPPPPPPSPPPCAFPALLGTGRTGCGSGPDFGHFDYPPNTLSTASAAKLAAWAAARPLSRGPFRSFVTDTECEIEMDGVLVSLAGGDGHAAFSQFVSGAGGTVTHGVGSSLGSMALVSGSFLSTVATVQADIEAQLAVQATTGALDPCALAVTPPATAFGFSDGVALKAVIGGTHGETLFANGFTGSIPLRTYTIDLRFVICDNFGVDETDLYAHGLYGFWVLQHERSSTAYAPFINTLDLTVTVSGTF